MHQERRFFVDPPGSLGGVRDDYPRLVTTDDLDRIEASDLIEAPEGPAADPAATERTEAEGTSRALPLRRILVFADAAALLVGWLVAQLVFDLRTAGAETAPGGLRVLATVVFGVAAGLFLFSANGLYRRRVCQVRSVEVARLLRVVAMLTALAAVVSGGAGTETAMLVAGTAAGVWTLVLLVERGFLREWIQGCRASGEFRAPVVVVGAGDDALATASFLAEHPVLGFDVLGVVGPVPPGTPEGPAWLGDHEDVRDVALTHGATGVVVDGGSLTGRQLNDTLRQLADTDLHVHLSSGLRGVDWRRITVSPLADETYLHIAPTRLSQAQRLAKRILDVGVSAGVLLLGLPLLAVIALAVKVADGGPVLFRQTRVGQDGEPFTVLKFRTMAVDAERRLAELQAGNARSGPLFKLDRDPRVTRVGRLLRATSLDEIPQLFNVLGGSMSLVGPRPALPEETVHFDPELASRTRVKPGVTGLWQVEARDLASFDLYRRYDLLYVENWSLSLDLAVIARTATSVVVRGLRALVPQRGAPLE
ncbi:sugar transferase [Egicoccus halophilus]|uniref:Bacterial sugar transferase domain-containing protein n=1 Tax=Egicoccus halophilus TaxID=1670830 RepID=A0A8J3ER24_9ACTN|nr:sugar transferase [Egicoccus halophilus]GGI03980.1 hypothetical protein GCM10011354_06760 [Egicoccus halophilus]